jgi:hypothetical protein
MMRRSATNDAMKKTQQLIIMTGPQQHELLLAVYYWYHIGLFSIISASGRRMIGFSSRSLSRA